MFEAAAFQFRRPEIRTHATAATDFATTEPVRTEIPEKWPRICFGDASVPVGAGPARIFSQSFLLSSFFALALKWPTNFVSNQSHRVRYSKHQIATFHAQCLTQFLPTVSTWLGSDTCIYSKLHQKFEGLYFSMSYKTLSHGRQSE